LLRDLDLHLQQGYDIIRLFSERGIKKMLKIVDLYKEKPKYDSNYGKHRWAVQGSGGREDLFRTRKLAREFKKSLALLGVK